MIKKLKGNKGSILLSSNGFREAKSWIKTKVINILNNDIKINLNSLICFN